MLISTGSKLKIVSVKNHRILFIWWGWKPRENFANVVVDTSCGQMGPILNLSVQIPFKYNSILTHSLFFIMNRISVKLYQIVAIRLDGIDKSKSNSVLFWRGWKSQALWIWQGICRSQKIWQDVWALRMSLKTACEIPDSSQNI